MATRNHSNPLKSFAPRVLPWLLTVAVFGIYALTLNHSVSAFNYLAVAKLSGWTWQPEFYNPLFFTFTLPLRWLPETMLPMALNLFSAICATLSLGLLARSVAILPHDRTDAQREREQSVFSFLTGGSAWLPPVFAVLVCGLQMTFWEQSTNCTTEMFGLLLFAFVIWSLLEYRMDERVGRLYLAALVYGAGMAENWAMVGFLPVFVGALIWMRGMSFFNLRFLAGMTLGALVGMSFYLVLPLLAVSSDRMDVTFWQALKLNLSSQWVVVKMFFTNPEVRKTVLMLSPASLLPVLLLAIRWKSGFGDSSKIGLALASFMFHLIHALLLFVCVWVAFDPPFGPRQMGFGLPFLTFFYLGALSVGYYSGYFLVIFGKQSVEYSRRSKSRLQERLETPHQTLNRVVIVGIWIFAVVAVAGLAYKNIPQIQATNDDTFHKLSSLAASNLPQQGGLVISDDSRRLIFVRAALTQSGRAKDFAFVDTQFLPAPSYHAFLNEKFPQIWPDSITAAEKTNGISILHLISVLAAVSKTNELFYLHPSFGYYFEHFYAEPRGLVYKLNILPDATLLPPPLNKNQLAANDKFWSEAEQQAFAPIIATVTPDDSLGSLSLGEKLLGRFHVKREPNPNAAVAGEYYSRSLNYWGVQSQRAGNLTNAAACFETALKLNPDNTVAKINLQFNQSLRDGKGAAENLAYSYDDPFGKYRTIQAAMSVNGPFDVPSFCFQIGANLASQNGFIRQAVEPFERVRQLVPNNFAARMSLAELYLVSRLPDRALDALHEPLNQPAMFSLNPSNSTQLNMLAAAAYFQKTNLTRGVELLELEMSRHPENDELIMVAAQSYTARGMFSNALAVIDRKLKLAPDDPTWLFGKGYTCIQMEKYPDAITALTRLLTIQTNNPDALFNRAIACLKADQLDAARADFKQLQVTFTNSFQISYGLGEIAWRKNETNEAVKNYRAYLANADTNTVEAKEVIQRLRAAQSPAH